MPVSILPPGYPETISLTVRTPAERLAVEKALAMAQELQDVTATAALGHVLERCEEAAVAKGQELTRAVVETTVQQFIDAEEKKGAAGVSDLRRLL